MIKKISSIFLFFFLPNLIFPQLNIVKSIKVKSERHLKSNFIFDKNDFINIINDYVFMTFLLGNDFLPHISSLGIKNGGILFDLNRIKLTKFHVQKIKSFKK